MRVKDVPQDDADTDGLRRGDYALDENGRYTVVATSGWEVERAANEIALLAVDREVERAWQSVRDGRRSPLAYYMAQAMLTPGVLAEGVGLWRLRVAWHLRPRGFAGLSDTLVERYAKALGLTAEQLRSLPPEPARMARTKECP